jgi:hypothetical protein
LKLNLCLTHATATMRRKNKHEIKFVKRSGSAMVSYWGASSPANQWYSHKPVCWCQSLATCLGIRARGHHPKR